MQLKVSWERWMRTVTACAVFTVALLVLAACAAPPAAAPSGDAAATADAAAPAGEPQKGGVLTVARPGDANLWDPKFTNDNHSLWAQNQIYATLMQNSPDGKELRPWLAESFEFNDDATEVTFKLHDNAKFCDGTPITADDVKWSLDRGMEEDSAVSWQFFSSPKIEVIDPTDRQVHARPPQRRLPQLSHAVGHVDPLQGLRRGQRRRSALREAAGIGPLLPRYLEQGPGDHSQAQPRLLG